MGMKVYKNYTNYYFCKGLGLWTFARGGGVIKIEQMGVGRVKFWSFYDNTIIEYPHMSIAIVSQVVTS